MLGRHKRAFIRECPICAKSCHYRDDHVMIGGVYSAPPSITSSSRLGREVCQVSGGRPFRRGERSRALRCAHMVDHQVRSSQAARLPQLSKGKFVGGLLPRRFEESTKSRQALMSLRHVGSVLVASDKIRKVFDGFLDSTEDVRQPRMIIRMCGVSLRTSGGTSSGTLPTAS